MKPGHFWSPTATGRSFLAHYRQVSTTTESEQRDSARQPSKSRPDANKIKMAPHVSLSLSPHPARNLDDGQLRHHHSNTHTHTHTLQHNIIIMMRHYATSPDRWRFRERCADLQLGFDYLLQSKQSFRSALPPPFPPLSRQVLNLARNNWFLYA